jgi:hypothetical protein
MPFLREMSRKKIRKKEKYPPEENFSGSQDSGKKEGDGIVDPCFRGPAGSGGLGENSGAKRISM